MQALGIIETNSIAVGIAAGDAMLKTAQVDLISAQAVCAGKYIVIIKGDVAAVKSSIEKGKTVASSSLVNDICIANLHADVYMALCAATQDIRGNAIGIIETFSIATCVRLSDTIVKTADITLIEIRLGRGLGGKSFVIYSGDVSAVGSATSAAKNGENNDLILNAVVIPSIHKDMLDALK